MSPKTKLQIAIGAIVALVAFGTIGFKLLEGWPWFDCFYFTLITITTIGFGEPGNMHHSTRYFTVAVIVTGLGTVSYALSAAAQAVIDFEFVSRFGKRRMFKDINKLTGHYILCGAGRVGRRVIREMSRRGVEFVVIEADEAHADRML